MSARHRFAVATATIALAGGLVASAGTAEAASPHSSQAAYQCWTHGISMKGAKAYYRECRSADGKKSWVSIAALDTRTDGKCAVADARIPKKLYAHAVSCTKNKWSSYHSTGWHKGDAHEYLKLS